MDRGEYQDLMDRDTTLSECLAGLKDQKIVTRRSSIERLAQLREAKSVDALIDLLDWTKSDYVPSLAFPVIQALTQIGDIRATFPMINFARRPLNVHHIQAVLWYFCATGDPRAVNYIKGLKDSYSGVELPLALEKCKGNHDVLYPFCGPKPLLERAFSTTGQILVSSASLSKSEEVIRENASPCDKPQTYILGEDGQLFIGGSLNEHVLVARGEAVHAAGEIQFEKQKNQWKVTYVSNRSNGYYPGDTSFFWVHKFFEKSDISLEQQEFDEIYPRDGFDNEDFLSVQRLGSNESKQ